MQKCSRAALWSLLSIVKLSMRLQTAGQIMLRIPQTSVGTSFHFCYVAHEKNPSEYERNMCCFALKSHFLTYASTKHFYTRKIHFDGPIRAHM